MECQLAHNLRHALKSIAASGKFEKTSSPTCGHSQAFGIETNRGIGAELDIETFERGPPEFAVELGF